MNHVNKRNGFTLIELMLAMVFVSFLLIAIAMTVIQIGNIYNRGLTLKDVNQAGRSIASELQRSINQAPLFSVDTTSTDSKFISQTWGGRLCTGQYSYIWNYGRVLDTADTKNIYDGNSSKIRFVKVLDSTANYCKNSALSPLLSYPDVKIDGAVELLDVGQHNLAIHSFTISSSAKDSTIKQQLYNIQFTIGTNDQNALINSSSCRPPSDAASDLNYCSINQFNITVRAGNKTQ